KRQREEIERLKANEDHPIPADIDYANVRGLSAEVTEKLSRSRPETIGRAGRISGVTPAAISLLLVHLKKTGAPRRKAG
ncbi:MAG: tRNA uridine-5-carboxymethylaminomethyl(34) synthesis enzyme MnmG, partial [Pseudomonadota bacterium]